ncbi:NAD(P)-binding protein [Hysterangium stoloniferum]|nr:NAD(P)-binding protein [Hysterangium stoloniferum]
MPIISNTLAKCIPNSPLSHTLFPPQSKFDPQRDMPDLSGKVGLPDIVDLGFPQISSCIYFLLKITLVTGGNSGIGYQTVRHLLLKNAKVYLAARSASKAAEAVAKLKEETGKEAIVLKLDLGDLSSVKNAAAEYLQKEERLDILFNNAGVMAPPFDQLTSQGYDLQFGTNVLGHYYFTMLLFPVLRHSTTARGIRARVINTSSLAHTWAPGNGLDWSVVKGGPDRDAKIAKWGTSSIPGKGANWHLYGISKIGNIFFTHILNRYHGDEVISIALHPGGIRSGLQRHGSSMEQYLSEKILHPIEFGPLSQLWAGTMPEAEETAVGAYLVPWARIGNADPRAANVATQDELKAYLEDQIRVFESSAS